MLINCVMLYSLSFCIYQIGATKMMTRQIKDFMLWWWWKRSVTDAQCDFVYMCLFVNPLSVSLPSIYFHLCHGVSRNHLFSLFHPIWSVLHLNNSQINQNDENIFFVSRSLPLLLFFFCLCYIFLRFFIYLLLLSRRTAIHNKFAIGNTWNCSVIDVESRKKSKFFVSNTCFYFF